MKRWIIIFFISTFFFFKVFCQQPDTLIHKEDSLLTKTDTAENLPITFSTYFTLLGSDFKRQFTAPFHQTGKEWIRIGVYTAGMVTISQLVDEPVQHFAVKIKDSSAALTNISGYV